MEAEGASSPATATAALASLRLAGRLQVRLRCHVEQASLAVTRREQ